MVEGFASCHSTDEAVKFVKEWLVGKNQASTQELERKIQELDQREEKFNQHVAVIPESDEVAIQLTAEIQSLKESLDKESEKLTEVKTRFDQIKRERAAKFMSFYTEVANALPRIYKSMTGGVGTGSLLIADSADVPFESPIVFDFCPPGKRHGCDISQLSGGEKSIAALSFVFALTEVKRPPLMILDEVDAFLDAENVKYVTDYLRKLQALQTQVLIVSHKEDLACQSQSLIGVCMKQDEATSQTFSLDLQNYA